MSLPKLFLIMDGEFLYSEFLTSSSWFYIRLKLLKLLLKIKIEKEEVKVPFTLLKFYKNQLISEHLQPLRLS
jgi:hypothetical protein